MPRPHRLVMPTDTTPWSDEEYLRLVDMRFRLRMPVDLIAEALPGRSYAATRAKLNKILKQKRREAADAAGADIIPAEVLGR